MVSLQRSPVRVAQGVLLLFLVSGCGKPAGVPEDQSPEALHLKKVLDLCNEYKSTTKKDANKIKIDEVKEWAVKAGKATDDDFIAPRDKQTYGIAVSPMGGFIIYEQTGKGGKRYTSQMGRVFEEPSEQVDNMIQQFNKDVGRGAGGKGAASKTEGK